MPILATLAVTRAFGFSKSGVLTGPSGYFLGGSGTSSTNIAFLFATETNTILPSSPTNAYGAAAFANRAVAGYLLGGPSNSYTVEKYSFPTGTKTTLSSMNIEFQWWSGWENGSTCAYMGGPYIWPDWVSTVYKYTYSSETRSTAGGAVNYRGQFIGVTSNYGVAGYQFGGLENGTNPRVAKAAKYQFSTESSSSITSLTIARDAVGAFANDGVAAYAAGGYYGDTYSVVEKYALPSDSRTTLASGLYDVMRGVAGVAKSGVAGYVSGGANYSGVLDTIQKFSFPSDTRSTIAQRTPAPTQFQMTFSSTV